MNKSRRKQLGRAQSLIEEAKSIVLECCEEEQEYLDNMPESMRGGEKSDITEQSISAMEDAKTTIDEVIETLGGVVGQLDEVFDSLSQAQE